MPRYAYRCEKCEQAFEVIHSMSFKLEKKDDCADECQLVKIPAIITIIKKETSPGKKKVGEVVQNSIESFKEDLKSQRKDLLNKVYEEND